MRLKVSGIEATKSLINYRIEKLGFFDKEKLPSAKKLIGKMVSDMLTKKNGIKSLGFISVKTILEAVISEVNPQKSGWLYQNKPESIQGIKSWVILKNYSDEIFDAIWIFSDHHETIKETEKAVKIAFKTDFGDIDMWTPKSQI